MKCWKCTGASEKLKNLVYLEKHLEDETGSAIYNSIALASIF